MKENGRKRQERERKTIQKACLLTFVATKGDKDLSSLFRLPLASQLRWNKSGDGIRSHRR